MCTYRAVHDQQGSPPKANKTYEGCRRLGLGSPRFELGTSVALHRAYARAWARVLRHFVCTAVASMDRHGGGLSGIRLGRFLAIAARREPEGYQVTALRERGAGDLAPLVEPIAILGERGLRRRVQLGLDGEH